MLRRLAKCPPDPGGWCVTVEGGAEEDVELPAVDGELVAVVGGYTPVVVGVDDDGEDPVELL